MAEEQSFLGTGWSFPPTFIKQNKGVGTISDVEDINSSLHILLSTRLGERVMQPEYGCNLDMMLWWKMPFWIMSPGLTWNKLMWILPGKMKAFCLLR